MGGAYTAVADDAVGCYYNPAGIIKAKEKSVSISGNAFKFAQKSYKEVLGKEDWVRTSQGLVLNYFGNLDDYKGGKIGFSMAVPDAEIEDMDKHITDGVEQIDTSLSSFSVNIDNNDTTYNLGPCYGRRINKDISIGITLYGHYRRRNFVNTQILRATDKVNSFETFAMQNSYETIVEFGLRPVIGILYEINSKFSTGLIISKTELISSDTKGQIIYKNFRDKNFNLNDTPDLFNFPESEEKRKLPLNITLGNALRPTEKLLLDLDLSYFEKVSNKNRVINFALGSEYYFRDDLTIRSGIFSDFANTASLINGAVNQPEHVDIYGLSLIFSKFSKTSSFSMGGVFSYGNGKGQPVGDQAIINTLTATSFQLLWSAAHYF